MSTGSFLERLKHRAEEINRSELWRAFVSTTLKPASKLSNVSRPPCEVRFRFGQHRSPLYWCRVFSQRNCAAECYCNHAWGDVASPLFT
jgi:hypothetical protein